MGALFFSSLFLAATSHVSQDGRRAELIDFHYEKSGGSCIRGDRVDGCVACAGPH